jgi:transposase
MKPGSLYYTDDWHAHTYLAIRENHLFIGKDKGRPKGRDHIASIEAFWFYAKHRLYQYHGVTKQYFHLYLKETEWRFNHRNENLVPLLKKNINQPVIKWRF